jgi:hypothetical protein
MKKIILLLGIVLVITSCASTVPVDKCLPEDPYGFLSGIWHGIILPFSMIGSWFSDSISIYAVNNNGGWYDFGFVLGIGGVLNRIINYIGLGLVIIVTGIVSIFK